MGQYGLLTPIYKLHNTKGNKWLCVCDCGNLTETRYSYLTSGHTKSCGCLHFKTGITVPKRLRYVYDSILTRCYNQNSKKYKDYGERGIAVCDEWLHDRRNFYEWAINNGYKDTLTIDRINVNGNYEPSNCRWATAKQQANNKRTCRYITINGKTNTFKEWCNINNIPYKTAQYRVYKAKWSDVDAVTIPIRSRK